MTPEAIHDILRQRFDEAVTAFDADAMDPTVTVKASAIRDVATLLRGEPDLLFDSLMCLSGMDYGEEQNRVGVVYHLHSTALRHAITVRVELPRQGGVVPTVSDIWRTAEWHEREAFDLFGMHFDQHPDHRRILLPDDWEGHPLLKDYEVQEFYQGIRVPYEGDPPEIGMDVYRFQDRDDPA